MFSRKYCLQNLLLGLSLLVLAGQCNSPAISAPPTPPLPATPGGPTLRIALLSPDSGELATFGRMTRNGSIMAFETWNQQGGVLDRHIAWTIYDTACDFDTAREAAQQAIADGHTFIIGPVCSAAAIGAATIAENEQVVLISPTATHPLLTINGQGQTRPSVFRAGYAWPWQAQAAAQFALDDLQTTQAAILTTSPDDYGVTLADSFAQTFTRQSGEIVYRGIYQPGDPALADTLAAIEQSGASVIYLPVAATVANQIGAQRNTMGLNNITLIGSDSWETAALDRTATAGSYFTTHFASDNPHGQVWAEAYKSSFAIEPNTLAALGYEAAIVLLNAIEQANSLNPAEVARTMEISTFTGVTGPLQFDEQHNPAKPVPIVRVEVGNVTFVRSIMP